MFLWFREFSEWMRCLNLPIFSVASENVLWGNFIFKFICMIHMRVMAMMYSVTVFVCLVFIVSHTDTSFESLHFNHCYCFGDSHIHLFQIEWQHSMNLTLSCFWCPKCLYATDMPLCAVSDCIVIRKSPHRSHFCGKTCGCGNSRCSERWALGSKVHPRSLGVPHRLWCGALIGSGCFRWDSPGHPSCRSSRSSCAGSHSVAPRRTDCCWRGCGSWPQYRCWGRSWRTPRSSWWLCGNARNSDVSRWSWWGTGQGPSGQPLSNWAPAADWTECAIPVLYCQWC